MEIRRIDPVNCSVARALAVVGERWSLLIVREALDGARRFGEFRARLGMASNLLAARLDTLVTAGVMRRAPYQEPGDRQRFEYHLTEQGHALRPTLIALLEWGDKYLADPQGPSVIVRHRLADDGTACEEPVKVVLECAAGHTHLPPEGVYRAPGPGARFLDPAGPGTAKGSAATEPLPGRGAP
ncbi:winged helix-turn-helix transcriptional regulator [Nonomuraea sp. GTA35]|uniref:winged helix-turn-helix transcriptional regulator n=1 Tax=Nonomuraea sp. GTA35 TaxID=1676746 RepID=UPI0035BF98BE